MGRRSRGSVQDRENLAAEPAEERTRVKRSGIHSSTSGRFSRRSCCSSWASARATGTTWPSGASAPVGLGRVCRELRQLENAPLVRSAWSPLSTGPVPRHALE
jgi:hypothetical protein